MSRRSGKGEAGSPAAGGTRFLFADESAAAHPQCGLCGASQVPLQTLVRGVLIPSIGI